MLKLAVAGVSPKTNCSCHLRFLEWWDSSLESKLVGFQLAAMGLGEHRNEALVACLPFRSLGKVQVEDKMLFP